MSLTDQGFTCFLFREKRESWNEVLLEVMQLHCQ